MGDGTQTSKGQMIHAANMEEIEHLLSTYPPMSLRRITAKLSRAMGITPDTLRRNYISVLLEVDILKNCGDRMYAAIKSAEIIEIPDKSHPSHKETLKELQLRKCLKIITPEMAKPIDSNILPLENDFEPQDKPEYSPRKKK